MAKLYLKKLFPKLVSSLAVLLLLCQFGYVACQPPVYSPISRNATLPDDEAKALGDLMTTLGGDLPPSSYYCSSDFQGIKCSCTYDHSTVLCHVTGLDLSSRELDGQINAAALASLVHLEEIDLSNNQLDGSIPVTMGNLSSLTSLDLSNNQLDGSIPVTIGNLSSLTSLDLSNNQLDGSIPVTMGNLPSLTSLDLSTNFLIGSIPSSLGNLSSLQFLRLFKNFLKGSIPSSLGNLSSLKYLSLSYNKLSSQIPKELGNLSNLRSMFLGFNELNDQLPPELGRLRSLGYLDLSSNNLSGKLPKNYANLTSDQLLWFSVAGNRLTGQVPRFIANWTGLYYLFLSGNDFEGELPLEPLFNMLNLRYLFVSDVNSSGLPFPENANMKKIRYLVIRHCSISGEIPRYIGDWSSLKYLDLSFNNLTGGIPDSMKKLNLSKMNSIRDLKNKCRGKQKYGSLYINCGGADTVFDGKEFEADSATSNYYEAPKENWAYSCSGDFGSETYDSSYYIKNVECAVCDSAGTPLYNSSRLCPLSLTYYGFCLFKGNYTVKLYFAETVYQNDEDHSNLGKRVFDVYIQGKKELKDFNIKEMASGTNKTWTQTFTAFVGDDHLLTIHFFWAGKGSFQVLDFPYAPAALSLNGPLVAGISVTANFKVGGNGLSPSQIAGITAGSVFAPLLLLAFMWKMGWLRKSELDEITIEVQGKSFTLKQIIDAT